jgi:hypothetical protein
MSAWLRLKVQSLSEEIRNYPTPIARCDQQLPALLEERAKLMDELKTMETTACNPLALWANDGGSNAA